MSRDNAIWFTDDELNFIREEIEEKFGPRDTNGVTDGRAVIELIGERPSWVTEEL